MSKLNEISQPKLMFQHHYNLEYEFGTSSETEEQLCACNACALQDPLLSKIGKIFWIGTLFPIAYFYIWIIKLYAIFLHYKEVSQQKEFDVELSASNEDINFKVEDISSLYSNDPFSNKYEIKEIKQNINGQKSNNSNAFEAHCYTNKKFNIWCGRSFIAFAFQICITIVIICAVKYSSTDDDKVVDSINGNSI